MERRECTSPSMERVMRIAHEHIRYASLHPDRLRTIARQLKISGDAALALAIADHICEEFTLSKKAG